MKRRATALFLTILLLMTSMPTAYAEMFVIMEKPITVTYNGDTIPFPDANPQIQNGRTLVPVRAIMERAKMTVTFDESTKSVTAVKDDLTITMTLDNAKAQVNKGGIQETVLLDEPARLIEGRTFVPVRFIAESMGIIVNWNANGREVVMIDTDEWKEKLESASEFFVFYLNQKTTPETAYAKSIVSNKSLSISFKNAPEDFFAVQATGTKSGTVKITSNDLADIVFDGENTGIYMTESTNVPEQLLTAMNKEINLISPTNISADIVIDKEGALYCFSPEYGKILRDSGQEEAALQFEKNYVKYAPDHAHGIKESFLADIFAEGSWDAFVESVKEQDMYTSSVSMVDSLIDFIVFVAEKPQVITKTRSTGTTTWTFALEGDSIKNYIKAFKKTLDAEETQIEDLLNMYAEYSSIYTCVEKNGRLTQAKQVSDYKIFPAEDEESYVTQIHMHQSQEMTLRKFDSYKDSPVGIPKNVVTRESISYSDN